MRRTIYHRHIKALILKAKQAYKKSAFHLINDIYMQRACVYSIWFDLFNKLSKVPMCPFTNRLLRYFIKPFTSFSFEMDGTK